MEREPKTPRERAEDLMRLLVSDWRLIPWQVLWAIRIGIILGLLVAIGYFYDLTLWDWLKLLIVPAVIAAGGFWFNQQQQERQRQDDLSKQAIQREDDRLQQERELEIENQRAQDEALQAYLDQMGQLLLDKEQPLRQSKEEDKGRTLARARTLTVLTRLEKGERKESVVRFLFESGLINKDHVVLDLRGADLNGATLSGADLSGADLSVAHMKGADLSMAILSGADLEDATLEDATLEVRKSPRSNWPSVCPSKGPLCPTGKLSEATHRTSDQPSKSGARARAD